MPLFYLQYCSLAILYQVNNSYRIIANVIKLLGLRIYRTTYLLILWHLSISEIVVLLNYNNRCLISHRFISKSIGFPRMKL